MRSKGALPFLFAFLVSVFGGTGCVGPSSEDTSAKDTASDDGSVFQFPERPSFVVVLVDTLRRDHLGVYGYPKPTTPFLDRLVREGIVVENAWAQAPQTFMSTATLMTSRRFPLTTRNDQFKRIPGLNEEGQKRHARVQFVHSANVTLAEVLRDAGYDTFGAFTNPHHHPTSGFWQGFDDAIYLAPQAQGARRLPYGRGVDVYGKFFEWLDARQADGQEKRPFFAYLHLMEVHAPYRPPRKLWKKFVEERGENVYTTGRPESEPSTTDLAYTAGLYDGEIRFVDGIVEALVEELRTRGLWDRTLVVLSSDHGDELMDHGGMGHGLTVYPELLRVPLLLAGAGLADHPAAGGRLQGVVRNLDLAPTLAELAGVEAATFEGTSLAGTLADAILKAVPETLAYARIPHLRSLTDGRWHLIVDTRDGERRLFDLKNDPAELRDVAAEHPEHVRRLERRIRVLEAERKVAEEVANGLSSGGDVDPETVEQLKALGYLAD